MYAKKSRTTARSHTYYDWYARWCDGGIDALADRSARPKSVWNRIPDKVREDIVDFALDHEDLITAPAHVVICAADEFRYKTVRPNELWQTGFTYLKVIPLS